MRNSPILRITLWAVVCCLLGFISANSARAQNVYGKIRGTVTDPTGAVIAGAKITATNVATGISTSVTSAAAGSYEFLRLAVPAKYTVKAEHEGFRAFEAHGVDLNVDQIYVLDVKMEVGAVTQEVTVEANPAQIESSSIQLGVTITASQIVDLPLNGRNWTQLQQLEPGVVASSDRFGTYSTNGAETQQNSFLVDGLDTNDLPLNTAGFIPSPDAIGEFRMVTSTLNPEYGRNSGAIMNAVIKSGTNGFHGDGFEFYRDTSLDARSFFQRSVSPFHQNQFGGTVGGPIKKDRAFFFFSYQGLRNAVPQAFSIPTVFSSGERGGNFSDTNPTGFPSGKNVSPFPLEGTNGTMYPAGTPYATLFPDGNIPTADLNPLAVKLMGQFVPLPNAPGNGYAFNPTTTGLDDQFVYKVDANLRVQDVVSFTGSWERNPTTSTLPFTGATLPGFASTNQRHIQTYTGTWNHTFSPTTLNNARFSYYRFNFDAVVPVNPINPTTYGFTGILPQTYTDASLPVISLAGFFTLGFSANGPQPRIDQTYDFSDGFSKVVGHHTFKAGFEMERFQVYNPFFNNLGGNFTLNGGGTFSTGNPGADFLLGLSDSYAQGSGAIINARGQEYYSYAQDQWKVKPNLTLTYGLGWDIETPYQNLFDKGLTMMAFRAGQQSTVFPTAPVGFVYPGDPGINKYGGPTTQFKNVAPRLGFAWSPGSSAKWSIRGGFGLYYNRTEEELALQGLTNPPFSTTSSGVVVVGGSPSLATPFTGWCAGKGGAAPAPCSTAQVFPFAPPAPGTPVNFAQFAPIGFGANTLSPNFGTPMSENYNVTVERQLSPSTVLSIGFVGNLGHHLEGAYNTSYAGAAPGVNPGAAALGCNAFNLTACDPASFSNIPNPAVVNPVTGLNNAELYGETGYQVTDFNSNYNSLQIQLNRHLSKGLQIQAAYTWSRYFDQTSNLENSGFNGPGINPFSFASMYAPSNNDAPQRFVVNYFYTLPFYSLTHKWRRLTDGWSVTGITTFQHGFPIAVGDFSYHSLTCDPAVAFYACPDRADATGQPVSIGNPRNNTINGSPHYWFSPAAFSVPAAGSGIGNASRNPLYGPGINNWDIALEKDLHITESKYFQFRVETFNTWNHAQFQLPTTPGFSTGVNDVSSSIFGRLFGVIQGSTNGSGRVFQLGGKFYF